jgi:tight adherence protein C
VHWVRAHLGLADAEDLPARLANAGYKGHFPVDVYDTARVVCPGARAGRRLLHPGWPDVLDGRSSRYRLHRPNIALTRLIKRRREKIRRSIPDAIDLLVICVDAGLGIDQALLRVGQELGISHPQITEELLQINREQRAGKPRIQAWADMAERSELSDIDAFSSMLLQTERFGTPIARALSAFADTIRLKRRQLAEQMAAKTTDQDHLPAGALHLPQSSSSSCSPRRAQHHARHVGSGAVGQRRAGGYREESTKRLVMPA